MDLDYICMKNFRQYRDTKIEFARSSSANITIIQGANGAGKTNILNALTWCLFGEEYHMDSKYKGLPIVNADALDESKKGVILTSVEVQFVDDNGKKILISRTINYRELNGKLVEFPGTHAPPCIMLQTGRDWGYPTYGEDAQFRINSLISKEIEEYFFFDGERMDDYFKEKSGAEIQDAVFQISQLELFVKLIDHLSKRKNEFVKQTKGLSPEVQSIQDELEIHERSLVVDKEKLEELKQKKNEAEQLEHHFSELLQNSSIEHVKGLEAQRVLLDAEINRLQNEIKDLEDDRIEALHSAMPTILAYSPLLKTKLLIEGKREAGLIPPMYKTIFIKDLLNKDRCICRSDISEKDEYSSARRRNVEAFLEEGELSEMSSELIEVNVRIQEMLEKIKSFPDDIRTLEKRLESLEDDKKEKNERIDTISQQIKQTNLKEIESWEDQKQKFAKERDSCSMEIGRWGLIIDQRTNKIRSLDSKRKQEIKKQAKYDNLNNLLAFCDDGVKCAEETKDVIMKEVKKQVEKKASEQFLALIWKKNTYKGLTIDDNYNISVPYVDGREALGTLSAGERQVCALSFMAALNSVSGFKIPIIIDTPLARISREPRKNIAENLPNYLGGTQLTLLVTEEEYTKEVKEALSGKVGKTYLINFEETEKGKKADVELVND